MDIERAVVSKIISNGQVEEALAKGITADHFADPQCAELYLYVNEHKRRYKTPPSGDAIRQKIAETESLKSFELLHVEDSLDFLLDRFIVTVKRRFAQEMAVELAQAADDPERGATIDLEFLEVSRKLATLVPSTQVARFSDMDKRIEVYEKLAKEQKEIGIPFGFPRLDQWTGGIQPHEFVTISGFSGTGKSTLLMVIAFNAYVQGRTPLYISLEMEASAILRKFDAMAAELDYMKIKHLDLSDEEKKQWRDKAKAVRERVQDIPVIDSLRGCTPDHIFAETVRHKPDLVVVDYLSLMRSSRPQRHASLWQDLTEITQDLKQNARTLHIPVLAAAQTNRSGSKDGAELDNIGYSISVVQDSDIVIGLMQDADMKERKEMTIRLNKNRDGKIGEFPAVWDHETMTFREKTMKDLYKRVNPDGEDKPGS